jgi:hypothetical protein
LPEDSAWTHILEQLPGKSKFDLPLVTVPFLHDYVNNADSQSAVCGGRSTLS